MKAIHIDPFAEKITEVQTDGSLREIYVLTKCNCIDAVRINDVDDAMYVDDEGIYKHAQRFFMYGTYPQPLAGMGLILGTTSSGDNEDCKVTLDEVQRNVRWLPKTLYVKGMQSFETMATHPLFGDTPVPHIGSRVVWGDSAKEDKEG